MSEQPFNHAGFAHFLAESRLMAARCQACGQLYLPPRALCPVCHAAQMAWEVLSGQGILEGLTTIYVGLSEMAALGYDRQKPYAVGVARLAEGPLIAGQLTDASLDRPQQLKVGAPVRAVFITRAPRGVVLGFELLGD